MGINGGRSLRGIEEEGYVRHNISLPPSINERLEKFMKEEERVSEEAGLLTVAPSLNGQSGISSLLIHECKIL